MSTTTTERLSFGAPRGTRATLDELAGRLGYKGRGGRGDLIRSALASAHPSTIEADLDKRPRKEPRSAKGGRLWGDPTAIYLPPLGDSQQPRELRARYAVLEADRLVNSNDPLQGFKKRAGYPSTLQPRDYAGDVTERLKVERIAQALKPDELINDAPNALTGPPILLPELAVAGGNGRSMALQVAYRDNGEPAKNYRAHIQQEAAHYGLDPAEVAGFKQPVLVRVLDEQPKSLRELGHDLNTATGNSLDALNGAVAEGERLTPDIISALARIEPDESLGAFLARDRVLRAAIQQAVPAGLRSSLFDKKGELTEGGETWLTWAMLGRLLPSAPLLELLGPRLRSSLGGAAPFFLVAGRKPGWDVSEDLERAVRLVSAARAQGVKTISDLRPGGGAFFSGTEGAEDPTQGATTRAALLAEILLTRSGPRQLQGGARRYEQVASGQAQVSLFVQDVTPVGALADAYGVSVPKVQWAKGQGEKRAHVAAITSKGDGSRPWVVELYPLGEASEDAERRAAQTLAPRVGGAVAANTDRDKPGAVAVRVDFETKADREEFLERAVRDLIFTERDTGRQPLYFSRDSVSYSPANLTQREASRTERSLKSSGFTLAGLGDWRAPKESLTKAGALKDNARKVLEGKLGGDFTFR